MLYLPFKIYVTFLCRGGGGGIFWNLFDSKHTLADPGGGSKREIPPPLLSHTIQILCALFGQCVPTVSLFSPTPFQDPGSMLKSIGPYLTYNVHVLYLQPLLLLSLSPPPPPTPGGEGCCSCRRKASIFILRVPINTVKVARGFIVSCDVNEHEMKYKIQTFRLRCHENVRTMQTFK